MSGEFRFIGRHRRAVEHRRFVVGQGRDVAGQRLVKIAQPLAVLGGHRDRFAQSQPVRLREAVGQLHREYARRAVHARHERLVERHVGAPPLAAHLEHEPLREFIPAGDGTKVAERRIAIVANRLIE